MRVATAGPVAENPAMTKTRLRLLGRSIPLAILGCLALTACPPAGTTGGGGGGGGQSAGIRPDSCGQPTGAQKAWTKVYAFLVASAELDRASLEMENSVLGACRKMASELGINPTGDTKTVCNAVSAGLKANLEISVSTEKRLVTREVPGECHTEWEFGANIGAQCTATANVDAQLRCNGTCNGTCSGVCDGTCVGGNTGGQCNSQCNGACNGKCSGGCDGYLTGDLDAECRAAVEVQSSVHTVCTPPKLVVVEESVTVVDATKFARAQAAIMAGLPTIRMTARRAAIVAKATVTWAKTAIGLISATGDLVQEAGERAVCLGGQIQAAVQAAGQIEARFSVSIEVSASISGSAGVQ